MLKTPRALYRQAHERLLRLQKQHGDLGVLSQQELRLAAEELIESLEGDDTFAPAYVLLAAVFASLNKTELAQKYLRLAQESDPELPIAAELSEQLAHPEALNGVLAPLRPLFGSAEDLQQAVAHHFKIPFALADAEQLYGYILGSIRAMPEDLASLLSGIPGRSGSAPADFVTELLGSPAVVLRQLHLLLVPLRETYATATDMEEPLADLKVSTQSLRSLWEVMHQPRWETPEQQLNALDSLWLALQPEVALTGRVDFERLLRRLKK